MGHLGNSKGIYVDCYVEDLCIFKFVNTASQKSVICPGVTPNIEGKTPAGLEVTDVRLMAMAGNTILTLELLL